MLVVVHIFCTFLKPTLTDTPTTPNAEGDRHQICTGEYVGDTYSRAILHPSPISCFHRCAISRTVRLTRLFLFSSFQIVHRQEATDFDKIRHKTRIR